MNTKKEKNSLQLYYLQQLKTEIGLEISIQSQQLLQQKEKNERKEENNQEEEEEIEEKNNNLIYNNYLFLKVIYFIDLQSNHSKYLIKLIINSIENNYTNNKNNDINQSNNKLIQEFVRLILYYIKYNNEYGFLQYSYLLVNLPLSIDTTIKTNEVILKILFQIIKEYIIYQSSLVLLNSNNSTENYIFAICGILKRNSTRYLTVFKDDVDVDVQNQRISWLVTELMLILEQTSELALIRTIIFDILATLMI